MLKGKALHTYSKMLKARVTVENTRGLFHRGMRVVAVWLLAAFTFMPPSVAALANAYATDDTELIPGMVVALSESSTAEEPKVERAALDKKAKVIGVSTTTDNQVLTVGSSNAKIFVQTTGEATVFVADINGVVKNGDLLAPSPLLGVLMKADESTAPVVGIAIEDFDENAAETQTVQEGEGEGQVKIDKIRVNLDHMAASNQQASGTDSSLERLGRAVVGKEVGEIQVIAALAIFLIVLVAEGGIIYGAISSSITAVGRNPLAGKIIRREMTRVVGVAVAVLVIGVAAIYAILWI